MSHPVGDVDPYKTFTFRVLWDGRAIAGVSKVTGLTHTTAVIDFRDGGSASTVRKLPGRTTYQPITLERGITQDTEFETWANSVATFGAAPGGLAAVFRRDIRIELLNEAGTI